MKAATILINTLSIIMCTAAPIAAPFKHPFALRILSDSPTLNNTYLLTPAMFSSSSIFIPTALLPVHPGPNLPGYDFYYYQPPFMSSMSSIHPTHTPGTILYNRGGDDVSNKSLIYTAVLSTYDAGSVAGSALTSTSTSTTTTTTMMMAKDTHVYTNLVFTQDLGGIRPEGVKIERVDFEVVEQADGTNFLMIDRRSEWSVCDNNLVWGRWDWMRDDVCEAVNIVVEQ